MNQGLILMAAWRIVDQPDDFLHAVLKLKYFPDSSIWRPNSNVPKSAFWASVLKILPILKAHTFYQISLGRVSIWSSPWCEGWAHIYDSLIIQPGNYTYPAQVKDLWLPNRKTWNFPLIDSLFQAQLAETIKRTPIICTEDEDFLCWKLTSTGKCNSKSAYKACLDKLHEQGEPRPRQVSTSTVQLLKDIWKNKNITPRVQTFGWRVLRKAIPTGARAGKHSKHISKLCYRCDLEESDHHLFFLCGFARAAWFMTPWCIKIDQIASPSYSISQILLNILNMKHPHGSIENILTFMWCIWKSRNDRLFNKKENSPLQIHHMANAIKQNLELLDVVQVPTNRLQTSFGFQQETFRFGGTIKTDLLITGSKIFSDAAWKTRKSPGVQGRVTTGLGVYCQLIRQNAEEKVMIQASTSKAHSPLLAEALALFLATQIAVQVQAIGVTFLTDNLTLAKAAASPTLSDAQVPWELRQQIAEYKKASEELNSKIYHIKRNLNGVAHDCAQQAIRHTQSLPIFSCSNSAHNMLGNCPIASSLQNFFSQEIVLHAVNCL
jgi:hypothetical protein